MSLSDALRAAALERARRNGHTIDGVVIEPTGVIDLREMARSAGRETDRSVRLPFITGHRLRAEREPERPLTETALWRRLRPAADPAQDEATLDLTADQPIVDLTLEDLDSLFEAMVSTADDEVDDERTDDEVVSRDATLTDERGQPVSVCDECGSFGQLDLLDRTSGAEFYSCTDCGHMWQQSSAG
jgi:hypothetical protein